MFWPESVGGLPLSEVTLPELLKTAGYNTFAIGKWHLGTNGKYKPTQRGFDHYFGVPYSHSMGCADHLGGSHPMKRECMKHSAAFPGVPMISDNDVIQQPIDFTTVSDQYVAEFEKRIQSLSRQQNPIFAYIPLTHVHTPVAHHPRFQDHSNSTFLNALYEMDWSIGEMMGVLERNGMGENTMVWVVGDNGPWEVQCQYAGIVSNAFKNFVLLVYIRLGSRIR